MPSRPGGRGAGASYGNVSVPTTPAWSEGQSLEGLVLSDGWLPMTFALTLLGTWTEKITSIRSSSSVFALERSDNSQQVKPGSFPGLRSQASVCAPIVVGAPTRSTPLAN